MKRVGWDDVAIGFALTLITIALFQIALWLGLLFAGIVLLGLGLLAMLASAGVER